MAMCVCVPGYSGIGSSLCTLCQANRYCPGDGISYGCPANTFSLVGGLLQTDCKCNAGFKCHQTRKIRISVTFLMTASEFLAQQSSITQNLAAFANVPISHVMYESSMSARRLLQDEEPVLTIQAYVLPASMALETSFKK